jgi:nitroreductase
VPTRPIDIASQNLFDIMNTTRAMRRAKPDPLPDEMIAKILQAGTGAPNGGNFQTWHFVVVKDMAIKKAVQVIYKKAFDEIIGPRYASLELPPGYLSYAILPIG